MLYPLSYERWLEQYTVVDHRPAASAARCEPSAITRSFGVSAGLTSGEVVSLAGGATQARALARPGRV